MVTMKVKQADQINMDIINPVLWESARSFLGDKIDEYINDLNVQDILLRDDLSQIEKQIALNFHTVKNGKVYGVKSYHSNVNTTTICEYVADASGMSKATPSTDTVKGEDHWLDEEKSIFVWQWCNYTKDADGTKRLSAMYGTPEYKAENGRGTIAPTFYYKFVKYADYDILYVSDSPHPELNLVPFEDAVKEDGTVLPYYILSSTVSDSTYKPVPGKAPIYNQSHASIITYYKGFGGGMSSNLHLLIFQLLKYATKSTQNFSQGCSNFSIQTPCAIAETGVKRVLTTHASFYPGCCVSVGTGKSADRGTSACHDIANRVKVLSIETVSVNGTSYYALNLDIANTIDTLTTYYISSMPCFNGETDAVIGQYDGAYLSNTNGRHTFRIHGVEYLNGQYLVLADTVLRKGAGDTWEMLKARKGVKHVTSGFAEYDVVGEFPYNSGSDYYTGDFEINDEVGAYYITSIGNGTGTNTADRIYVGGANTPTGSMREASTLGSLGTGGPAGFAYVSCGNGLSGAAWFFASRD